MRKMKKFLSIGLVAAMMTASLSVAGAEGVTPSSADKADIVVSGIETDATVTAYQVVEAKYNKYGLIGYKLADAIGGNTAVTSDDKIKDIENPTSEEITNLASDIYAGKVVMNFSQELKLNGDSFKASLPAGSYIVLVSGTENGEYVYNPVYVSAGYTNANDSSSLSQTGSINVSDGKYEYTNENGQIVTAYAKKSYTTLNKNIVDASTGNTETEDVAIGDLVEFEVTTTVPNYSEYYTNVVFKIKDTADAGLGVPTIKSVKVGDDVVAEGDDTYKITITDNDWEIDFNGDYIKTQPLKTVVISYMANVTEDAIVAGTADDKLSADDISNSNKAALTFTTTPDVEQSYEDTVNLYTFGMIGNKVDSKTLEPLAGAEFLLTMLDDTGAETDKTFTATSDADGKFLFDDGLDVGTYTLVETKAPLGYAISDEVYTIKLSATYEDDADGEGATITEHRTAYASEKIKTWTVDIVNKAGEPCVTTVFDASASTSADTEFEVPNTVLAKLPSTGGNGAYVFTGLGLAVVLAGAYLILGKKKENN